MDELRTTRESDDVVLRPTEADGLSNEIEQTLYGNQCPHRLGEDVAHGIDHVAEHVRVTWEVLLRELRREHNRIERLQVRRCNLASLAGGPGLAPMLHE
jgi:hypothetical protein